MSGNRDRVNELFVAALDCSDLASREHFLDRACAGDADLRQCIEDLIVAREAEQHVVPQVDVIDDFATTGFYRSQMSHIEKPGMLIAQRYKLLEPIGEGGMGSVWAAEQMEPVRRKVALKLIKAGMDSKSVLARFEAERQALALMDHANIAKVLDGGLTENGRPFFVMEYVKGVAITEYCDARRLSVPDRLELFTQVCQAVQHAHQKGIIHRDLKPTNILVAPYDDKPVPKVIDFGLAKAISQSLTERTLHTAHETVLGTPLYMSPEQAQLNNLDVDTRTDVYSLGVLLYELLTGTTPLEKHRLKDAAWDEVRRLIREEDPPAPSLRLSSADTLPSLAIGRKTEPGRLTKVVRGELDWIVMKALEKDRTRRYESASGFALDIQRFLDGEPVAAAPPNPVYRLQKLLRRHRWRISAGILVVVSMLAVVGAGVSLSYSGKVKDAYDAEAEARLVAERQKSLAETAYKSEAEASREAKDQRILAEEARNQAQQALNMAEKNAYFHKIALADAAWLNGDVQRADQLLDECPPRDRRWEWLLLKKRNHPELRSYRGHADAVNFVSFALEGHSLVSAGMDGFVRLWDVSQGRTIRVIAGTGEPLTGNAIHPNGRTLATTTPSGQVKLWDLSNGQLIHHFQVPAHGGADVAYQPSGKLLAIASGTQLTLWDPQENRVVREIATQHTTIIRQIAFAPDGDQLATVSWDGTIKIWNIATGKRKLSIPGQGGSLMSVAYSPDGKRLATGATDFRIRLWDARSGQLLHVLSGHEFTPRSLSFSPDNRFLASASADGSIKIWDSVTGAAVQILRGHFGHVYGVVYSSDGRRLASCGADGTVKLWSVPTDADGLVCNTEERFIVKNRIRFVAHGKQLIRTGTKEQLQVIDVDSGAIVRRFETNVPQNTTSLNVGLAAHPNGKLVAVGNAQGNVHVLDIETERTVWLGAAHFGYATALSFSSDGRWLVSGGTDGQLILWGAREGRIERTLIHRDPSGLPVIDAVFHPDSRRCVIVRSGKAELWDVLDGRLLHTFAIESNPEVNSAVFNANGTLMALTDHRGAITVWNFEQRAMVKTLKGHSSNARDVCFSPDGTRLASAGVDRRIKIWDVDTGYELLTLRGLINQASSISFDPTGMALAASDMAQTVRIWTVKQQETDAERDALAGDRQTAWQTSLVFELMLARDWPTTDWYLSRLKEAHPGDLLLQVKSAQLAAARGKWDLAIDIMHHVDEKFRMNETQLMRRMDILPLEIDFGRQLNEHHQVDNSIEWFNLAEQGLANCLSAEPNSVNVRHYLQIVLVEKARSFEKLKRFADAARELDKVANLSDGLVRQQLRLFQALNLVRAGEIDRIKPIVSQISEKVLPPAEIYRFLLQLAAALSDVENAEQKSLGEQLLVDLLNRALVAGCFNDYASIEHMLNDRNLDFLRETPNYLQFIQTLNIPGRKQRSLRDIRWGRATVLTQQNKLREALVEFRAALEFQDPNADALIHRRDQVPLIFQYGATLRRSGMSDDAEKEFDLAVRLREQLAQENVDREEDAWLLAIVYFDRALEYAEKRDFDLIVTWMGKAIDQLAVCAKRWPNDRTNSQSILAMTEHAKALQSLGRRNEADLEWTQAIKLASPKEQPRLRIAKAQSGLQAGMIEEAIHEVADLAGLDSWTANELYDLACVYSVSSGKKHGSDNQYGDRAMELLRKAVNAGFKDVNHMSKDTDLDPLRGRDEFSRMIVELLEAQKFESQGAVPNWK